MASSTLIARLIEDDVMHELVKLPNGQHVLRPFFHDVLDDRPLTAHEAGEWIDTVRKCGGVVFQRRKVPA